LFLLLSGYMVLPAAAATSLKPSVVTPAPVGTLVQFAAVVDDTAVGKLWFRFRVRPPGGEFHIVRDFGPNPVLEWATAGREGIYDVELTTRNLDSGETHTSYASVNLVSRTDGQRAAVSATSHPLVFLYSAPPCPAGAQMRVEFRGPEGMVQRTPWKPCEPDSSMNFYLAGLRETTQYSAHHVVDDGANASASEDLAFTTEAASAGLYPTTVVHPAGAAASNRILLGNATGAPSATDLDGNLLWYVTDLPFITRVEQGGYFWTIVDGGRDPSLSVVRKFDLVGVTVLETNAGRVNEQLKALGKRTITGFHHEATPLPDGHFAVLAGVEQILTDVQGEGDVNVLGDMIVVLDSELNVVWTWDAFDHLDVKREATMRETCGPNTGGCAPFYLTEFANDWTHGNSIQPTPDGQLIYSARHQDWLIKIDYSGGLGDGHVIWRLGKDGDFHMISDDPHPWFSHQHDGNFDPQDPHELLVFDNGNIRVSEAGTGHSRGQSLRIDEERRTVSLRLNADLGLLSPAVGSAQRLANGNYFFDAGFVPGPAGLRAYLIEVDPSGHIVFSATIDNLVYRSWRMTDMYTPE
jgi:hypothetical protein